VKVVLLNFGYGMGVDGSRISYLARAPLFFYAGRSRCVQLAELVKRENPDLVGLVEVDGGSMRAGFKPQWQEVAEVGDYFVSASCKYSPDSAWGYVPILQMHMNAILSKGTGPTGYEKSFYLLLGMKRLVLRQTFKDIDFYLVHLALDYMTRRWQLVELTKMVIESDSPRRKIIMGDFNSFRGRSELDFAMSAMNLKFASSDVLPTFPTYKPEKELDNILVSRNIEVVSCKVLPDAISDHRAILMEIK
jgi:endonuclease/exonuclease/phosphatase family metal-dependent hydrolase